ncbi:MAG: peptide chain release factor H [Deltaproteobacteria bacterium]|nr:peptide chain release factor H [Deltaproteobacteria bacterium]
MEIQISSGTGPIECELAVAKLVESLLKEFPEIVILSSVPGRMKGTFWSVRLKSASSLSFLKGTVQWICQSPYRPSHKRKNWFVDVSVLNEVPEPLNFLTFEVSFQTFRSSGKGGQNVNKVETGVRAIHDPTGLTATSTTFRTQAQNKAMALQRLEKMLNKKYNLKVSDVKAENRLEHTRLTRGNPIRVYQGIEFKRIK